MPWPSSSFRRERSLAAATVSFLQEIKATDTGHFQFHGPEGILDLRIAAEGSVPHYLWNVKSIGRTKDLGQLRLRTGSSLSGYVWDGVTDLQAHGATFSGLLPQTYMLQVQDAKSESTYLRKEILVEDDDFLFLDVPVVRLKGELTLNGDPLGASVRIETGSKDTVFLKSDPELGEFSGIIRTPEHDFLFVEIRSAEPRFFRRIVVENPKISDGLLEVNLDLVGVDVPGIVVDREGVPVSRAEVNVWSGRSIVSDSKTDARGEFTLTALDEGLYEIQAESTEKGSSEPVALEIRRSVLPPFRGLYWNKTMSFTAYFDRQTVAPYRAHASQHGR